MRKFGITLYFGIKLDKALDEQLKTLKKVGFSEISEGLDYINCDLNELREKVKRYGLSIGSLHSKKNKGVNINSIWKNTIETEIYLNSLKEDVLICSNLNVKYLVVHLDDDKYDGKYTLEGESNIRKLVEFAKENNVIICIENCYYIDLIKQVIKKIKSPYLKVCLDIGHLHALEKTNQDFEAIDDDNFLYNIKFLHLHGNYGKEDEHLPLQYSNMNIKFLQKCLSKIPNVTLTSETFKTRPEFNFTYEEYAKEILKGLKILDN